MKNQTRSFFRLLKKAIQRMLKAPQEATSMPNSPTHQNATRNSTPPEIFLKKLILHRKSKTLDAQLNDDRSFSLSAEYLRVHSPSAEVRGHGKPTLQTGKRFVGINDLTPVGHYGIRLHFDDGHDTGVYTWPFLIDLCTHQNAFWQRYLDELNKACASRDPHESPIRWSNNPSPKK